ncbi:FecR family protein [Sphingobacterium sp. HMA12]|uniref:FecR family protein n=1 Tax=Sphingobacterium sp. HMA12 TaxID=2050894 RepID=UPI000CEA5F2A|nr:FecR family protein [Sphingobacterium sp. HMA12]
MKANTNYIAKLIQKFLRGQETAVERDLIEHWRKSDKRNDNLIENFRDAKNIEQDLNFFADLDEGEAWRKVNPVGSAKKLNYWPLLRIAAIFVLLFGAVLVYLRDRKVSDPSKVVTNTTVKKDILPAQPGALLLLADGSVVPLESSVRNLDPKVIIAETKSGTAAVAAPPAESAIEYNTLVVPKGHFYKLNLEDGTQVWVNANSQLKFPEKFDKNERRVILDGEAYFEVSHDAERPFYVESKGNEVKVLGTHFNINAYGHNVRTTLSSGRVQVSHSGHVIVLEPGEYANLVGEQLRKGKADLEHDLSWHNNQFYFKKETIVEITSTLSKWYDIQVRFKKDVALDKVYTGNFKRDVKLSEVLEMLTYVCDLKFELQGQELIVENK